MTSALALVERSDPPPVRSVERGALAAAISRHSAAVAELETNKIATGAVRRKLREARSGVEQAEQAVEAAKANAAAVVAGTIERAPLSLGTARLRAEDAMDAMNAAQTALAALEKAGPTLESRVGIMKSRLDEAIGEVIQSETPVRELLSTYNYLQRQLARHELALRTISGFGAARHGGIPPDARGWSCEYDGPVETDLADAWRSALAVLREDADAPLPLPPTAGG